MHTINNYGYVSVYDMQFERNVTVRIIEKMTDVKASITYNTLIPLF
ncbi:MAG: hypothetical protein J6Q74_04135 [Clostridia bacterium]|nr:hypothetical protein [Clostridia bacterium]